MRSEIFYPSSVRDVGLSAVLLMCLYQNTKSGIFGMTHKDRAMPKCLTDDAWAQAGYCIDAPETMPAGSVMRVQINEELGFCGEQNVIYRDAYAPDPQGA